MSVKRLVIGKRASSESFANALSDQAARDQGCFLVRKGGTKSHSPIKYLRPQIEPWSSEPGPWTYKVVGTEWLKYHEALRSLHEAFEHGIYEVIEKGRIICVEETAKGDRMIAPNDAASDTEI